MNWERSKKCSNEAIRKAQNVSKQEIKKKACWNEYKSKDKRKNEARRTGLENP